MTNVYLGKKPQSRSKLLIICCLLGASLLTGAALWSSEKAVPSHQWMPLNEALKETMEQLETGKERLNQTVQVEQSDVPEGLNEAAVTDGAASDAVKGNAENYKPKEAAPAAPSSRDESGRLDINRASVEELDGLKGIGPAKAKAIVEYRERNGFFGSVDELFKVKGIGEKLLAGMKESVVARP